MEIVEPLWYGLRDHHARISPVFSETIAANDFQKRSNQIQAKARNGFIQITLVYSTDSEIYVGYCISTINESNEGEIDSIFIQEPYRKQGIGDKLMQVSLDWFQAHDIEDISISVMFGNDSVFPFYEKYGFYPRTYHLARKK
ncbi:GNAT family N-acetyltransferase [Fontibacillus sp. BL9]|uniref:GNAT family N-acetyltransferase n=1 Tax=Fontibacillus sp. BL9 TaxID=3389971 RepID=UPI003979D9C0